MKLALVRHLPTGFNRDGLLQGRRDEPILAPTQALLEEIRATRRRLEAIGPFDQILVSRLRRTRMTAEAYGYGDRLQEELLIDELDFGPFEGRSRAQMWEALGAAWQDNPIQLTLGESLGELAERVERFLEQYRLTGSVLVFGHGAWLRALVSRVRYGDINRMNRIRIDNNELIQLDLS